MTPEKTQPGCSNGNGNASHLIRQRLIGLLTLVVAAGLAGCGNDKPTGTQARVGNTIGNTIGNTPPLAKVNGVEIFLQQPANGEASAGNSPVATKEAVNKQLLEMMIDRQLLQAEALRSNLDRDPKVIQATEHARTQILAQAYLESRFAGMGQPGKADIDAYFHAHPELFSERKTFYMQELVIATKDVSPQLKARIDSAKSVLDVATWLDKHQVRYERTQIARSTTEIAPELITRLAGMRRNQLFIVQAGETSTLNAIYDIKSSPVTEAAAAPQIERYLRNKKRKALGDLELGRLRTAAKIEYFEKKQFATVPAPAARSSGGHPAIEADKGMATIK